MKSSRTIITLFSRPLLRLANFEGKTFVLHLRTCLLLILHARRMGPEVTISLPTSPVASHRYSTPHREPVQRSCILWISAECHQLLGGARLYRPMKSIRTKQDHKLCSDRIEDVSTILWHNNESQPKPLRLSILVHFVADIKQRYTRSQRPAVTNPRHGVWFAAVRKFVCNLHSVGNVSLSTRASRTQYSPILRNYLPRIFSHGGRIQRLG